MEQSFTESIQQRYGIIGSSKEIQEALHTLIQVAPTDLSVLISGETGTGKEVFAQALHGLSKRRKNPFISVNCGAIPETLLESELFGHEKGAFTGAIEQRIGFFEAANNGTIFLDEIGDMPYSLQVKLLRVLESGEFSRVGSSTVQKVDVRIVAATNRILTEDVLQGKFREDLMFRLNSVTIHLPPLRLHPEDIPDLVEHFAERTAEKIGVDFKGISNDALSMLQHLPWKGNIRELRNFVETLVTLERGAYITDVRLHSYIRPALPPAHTLDVVHDNAIVPLHTTTPPPNPEQPATPHRPSQTTDNELIYRSLLELRNEIADVKRGLSVLADDMRSMVITGAQSSIVKTVETDTPLTDTSWKNRTLSDVEKDMLQSALERYHGNRRMAAKALGIGERTMYRKMHFYGLFEESE
ncbi:MAG TPA: sigma-54 dependent transcriptional regulator [Candidatus Kapabacteria bacterium]|jgi:DNA-binding NtrC family response regulator|nr:sigma-54-dependent Fis family transcriptional regulator [Ignavibacteria bacterium]HRE58292.1 sigma-54 dependent transcriptional regulator [Candidatus Kapabacteria bacterium]HRK58352.1 sigma-54 dependent transcriptional regulator [Candidatus Kapabacteria bacterium]